MHEADDLVHEADREGQLHGPADRLGRIQDTDVTDDVLRIANASSCDCRQGAIAGVMGPVTTARLSRLVSAPPASLADRAMGPSRRLRGVEVVEVDEHDVVTVGGLVGELPIEAGAREQQADTVDASVREQGPGSLQGRSASDATGVRDAFASPMAATRGVRARMRSPAASATTSIS